MKKLSKSYIKKEWDKIFYTYNLNKEIRYALTRKEKYQTQSLSEHIANMLFLAHYFRDLEDPEHKLDFEKVIKMILFHDMGEIEVGDIPTHLKSENDKKKEERAIVQVARKSPEFVSKEIKSLFHEFENMSSSEGRFARAIDKLEGGLFFVISDNGVKMVRRLHKSNSTIYDNHVKRLEIFQKTGCLMIEKYYQVLYEMAESKGVYKPVKLKTKK